MNAHAVQLRRNRLANRTNYDRLMILVLASLFAVGCGDTKNTVVSVDADGKSLALKKSLAPTPKPKPKLIDWGEQLDTANALVASGQLDDVAKLLAALTQARDGGKLSEEQTARLTDLDSLLKRKLDEAGDQDRAEWLILAETLIRAGDLEGAYRALAKVTNTGPTPQQRESARVISDKIELTRTIRRQLKEYFLMLEKDNRSEIRTARSRLLEDPEVSLPMLLERATSDNPVLVTNVLQVMGFFSDKERTIPALIGVLAGMKYEKSWPMAIRQIKKLKQPGAGDALLELALKVEEARQRTAVLTALSSVYDPPARTLVSLLPVMQTDVPELTSVLSAAFHAAKEHRQNDLLARRGIDVPTPEQEKLLAALPQRLREIIAADAKDGELGETAREAMGLGILTGILEPQPLKGVKVTRPGDKQAQAAIDGQWNSIEAEQMWQHTLSGRPLIVFDLGKVRTVTGIRIWNYNLPGNMHRGWKEVDIFISPDRALLTPITRGQVPPAPGLATGADYSITLKTPFVRGRYIKLEPRSTWRNDGYGGVTEVEILGF